MFATKSFAFVLLCSTLACSVHALRNNEGTNGNNYVWGTRAATDVLLARETISSKMMLLQTVTRTYTLPAQTGTAKAITYISITDLKPKRGATAEIISGGVGSTTVTIRFTSARSGAIRSTLEIWTVA